MGSIKEPRVQDNHESFKKLADLIEGVEIAMLTTVTPEGKLLSRPMASQEIDEFGNLWFFTQLSSGKILSIEKDQHVNLAYSDPSKSRYVSVSGSAQIVIDPNKAEELWSPVLKAWFPEGLESKDLALIRVRIETAEYWDTPSATMVQLVGIAKAILTGEQYKPGENERLDLRH